MSFFFENNFPQRRQLALSPTFFVFWESRKPNNVGKLKFNTMPLYLITVKQNNIANGIRLEKGMSVEVVVRSIGNPVTSNGGKEVQEAFMRKYGIDLKKNCGCSPVYLETKKIG